MVFLQKIREILRKGSRVIATVFCVLLLVFMAIGCGKVEEPIPVQFSSGNVEELQNGSIGEIGDDSEEAADRDTETDQEDDSAGVTKVDTGDELDENTEDAPLQSVGSAELEGNVQSIGADSIVMMLFV